MKLFLVSLIIGLILLTPHQGMVWDGMAMDEMPVTCITICLMGGDAGSFVGTISAIFVTGAIAMIAWGYFVSSVVLKPFFEPALRRDRGRQSALMNRIVIRE